MATQPPDGYRPPPAADLYLMPCLPYDTSDLPQSAGGARIKQPVPSDTLGNCRDCGRAVWIGDKQQHLLAEVGPQQAHVTCYLCYLRRPDYDDLPPLHGLGPDNPQAYPFGFRA